MTPPRSTVRPRYGRLAAAGSAVTVTLVSLAGGIGLIDPGASAPVAAADTVAMSSSQVRSLVPGLAVPRDDRPSTVTRGDAGDSGRTGSSAGVGAGFDPAALAVPPDSGEGRRVVFDMSAQRVWLVAASGDVRRTYLVSGSVTDNLGPGSYEVYSTSEQAWGIDDSGTMKYMVRFTQGERAAIGFHDIPVKDGQKLQTRAQLGTPQSHGCIRQWRPDAKALWDFAPVGTAVEVVA
jgi:hypothetical protein